MNLVKLLTESKRPEVEMSQPIIGENRRMPGAYDELSSCKRPSSGERRKGTCGLFQAAVEILVEKRKR
jgi:hypothetical protein